MMRLWVLISLLLAACSGADAPLGNKEGETDGGLDWDGYYEAWDSGPPTAAEKANKVVRGQGNKTVRISTAHFDRSASTVSDPDLDQVVLLPSVPADATCNVVFEADPSAKKPKPDILDLLGAWSVVSDPVLMQEATSDCKAIWVVLLRGSHCLTAAGVDGYLGSSLRQLAKLPKKKRACVLRQAGVCVVNGRSLPCLVPAGDARANPGAPETFPFQWAGRYDLDIGGLEDISKAKAK